MRKLYNEFFCIKKHEKTREKVILSRITATFSIVVFCLIAMSLIAYAYFSCNVTSNSNIIKAANFDIDVSIHVTDSNEQTVTVTEQADKTKTAELKANTQYTIILNIKENSTAETGFCIISANGCQEKYHTQQLKKSITATDNSSTDKVVFSLKVNTDTIVYFVPHWGTSSLYADYAEKGEGGKLYITNANIGENTVNLVINSVTNSVNISDNKNEVTEVTTIPTPNNSTELIYEVQSGDTLWEISQKYGTSVAILKEYNKLTTSTIQIGQQIKIPPVDWVIPPETTEQTVTTASEHIQQPTDTTQSAETKTPETISSSETTGIPEDTTKTPETTALTEQTYPEETPSDSSSPESSNTENEPDNTTVPMSTKQTSPLDKPTETTLNESDK